MSNLKLDRENAVNVAYLRQTIENDDLIDVVKEELRAGAVEILFEKANGTDRLMQATLNMDLIPEDQRPTSGDGGGGAKTNQNPDIVNVFDIQVGQWRSFNITRLKSVVPMVEVDGE